MCPSCQSLFLCTSIYNMNVCAVYNARKYISRKSMFPYNGCNLQWDNGVLSHYDAYNGVQRDLSSIAIQRTGF